MNASRRFLRLWAGLLFMAGAAFSVHGEAAKLYWGNWRDLSYGGGIWRTNLDGSDTELIVDGADPWNPAQTGKVMTVEDHGISGGMGSAVCEALAQTTPARVHRVGLREYGESGSTEALYAKHHLDAEGVYAEAKAFLGSF